LKFEFKPSFDRSVKSLPPERKNRIKTTCLAFLNFLEQRASLPTGMGLKRLRDDFWEIRHGLRERIIFRWRDDHVEFILAGDHEAIRNYLKSL